MKNYRNRLGDKARAKAMYVSGMPSGEIAKVLSLPSSETVTNWAKKEGWQEERSKQLEIITTDLMGEMLEKNKKVLEDLETIRNTAIESIEDGTVTPQKFSEASNSYIAAIEAERKIKDEVISSSILNDVAQAILEEISDKEVLFKLGEKLRKIFLKYRVK